MQNIVKVLLQIWLVSTFNLWACRHTSEPPIKEDLLAGKAFFTGPTPVSQHHGIQVIAYLKPDSGLTSMDTTFTDTTGFYSFGKPSVDGVYMLTAYYFRYYPDTVVVQFQGGRREGEIRDMHIRQKARVKFTSDKTVYRLTDAFTWTVEVMNISNDRLGLPGASWFDYRRWHRIMFVSTSKPESRFSYAIGGVIGHFSPCEVYEPSATMAFTRSAPIAVFTDTQGNRISAGKYQFYATVHPCLPLEWNGRILPIFQPAEVEIIP